MRFSATDFTDLHEFFPKSVTPRHAGKASSAAVRVNPRQRNTFARGLFYDLFYASNGAALQPDFDPMRMRWGFCENILHNAPGQFAGALILFQDDQHGQAGFDGGARLPVHKVLSGNHVRIHLFGQYL